MWIYSPLLWITLWINSPLLWLLLDPSSPCCLWVDVIDGLLIIICSGWSLELKKRVDNFDNISINTTVSQNNEKLCAVLFYNAWLTWVVQSYKRSYLITKSIWHWCYLYLGSMLTFFLPMVRFVQSWEMVVLLNVIIQMKNLVCAFHFANCKKYIHYCLIWNT